MIHSHSPSVRISLGHTLNVCTNIPHTNKVLDFSKIKSLQLVGDLDYVSHVIPECLGALPEEQQRGGWSATRPDDLYLDTQMKTGANLQPELIYAALIWPLKPKTQPAASVFQTRLVVTTAPIYTCTDLCHTTKTQPIPPARPRWVEVLLSLDWWYLESLLSFCQWAPSFSGSGCVYLESCSFGVGRSHGLVKRWLLGGAGCSVTCRSLKHVWSPTTPHLRGEMEP